MGLAPIEHDALTSYVLYWDSILPLGLNTFCTP